MALAGLPALLFGYKLIPAIVVGSLLVAHGPEHGWTSTTQFFDVARDGGPLDQSPTVVGAQRHVIGDSGETYRLFYALCRAGSAADTATGMTDQVNGYIRVCSLWISPTLKTSRG